jgi:hypothetical protein
MSDQKHSEVRALRPHRISRSGVELHRYQVDDKTPYTDDPVAQALVEMHPRGEDGYAMSLDEIAAVLVIGRECRNGRYTEHRVSRERIRQIEASALRKLRRDAMAYEAWLTSMELRSREAPSMAMEDHCPEGDWPTYADSRRLQQTGNRGAWGWDGEARPPHKAAG